MKTRRLTYFLLAVPINLLWMSLSVSPLALWSFRRCPGGLTCPADAVNFHHEMKRQVVRLLFAFLFILSGSVAAYSQCAQADQQFDSGAEHKAPSIHCPETVSNGAQISSLGRSYKEDHGETLTGPAIEINSPLAIGSSSENNFVTPFSQRNLYQLEQVYRL